MNERTTNRAVTALPSIDNLNLDDDSLYSKIKSSGWQAWLGEGLRQISFFTPLRFITPLEVVGRENLRGGGPFIFAPNHSSHLDTPLLLAALPLHLRLKTRVAAAFDYFFDRPWKGALVRLVLNAVPFVRRGEGCQASLLATCQLVRQGHSLVIFPEGTRTSNGHLQPFKHGIGRLVAGSGVAVVPVWIDGTFASLPKGRRWPRRQSVKITFGPALRFEPDLSAQEIAAQVEEAVQQLSGQTETALALAA